MSATALATSVFLIRKVQQYGKRGQLGVMAGCMDKPALAIAAAAHWALTREGVQYADLDGHLDLIDDPSSRAVILKNGLLYTTRRMGLGFDLDPDQTQGKRC